MKLHTENHVAEDGQTNLYEKVTSLGSDVQVLALNNESHSGCEISKPKINVASVRPMQENSSKIKAGYDEISSEICESQEETMLSIVDVIKKKRDKQEWTRQDVRCFIHGATYGNITDAQIGAGLMAVCLNGMTDRETGYLTQEMINTGERIPRPPHWAPGTVVGKHSTGGVGDKVTIALVPALAACGLKVPKLSGRGLGHTGGTLDKLESIPGFRVRYDTEEVMGLVDRAGCCIVGVSEKLSPADKILYAIRDTTGTTESLPLVAGSVMCKKAAESLDCLALEVTYGRAALIKTKEEAMRLSRLMIETGRALGIATAAVLVRMDHVMGQAVGNSLEIEEAVDCMHGRGPRDVIDICCALGSYLLVQAGVTKTKEAGSDMIRLRLQDGSAARKFYDMMVAQGVEKSVAKKVAKLDRLSNGIYGNENGNAHPEICGCGPNGCSMPLDGHKENAKQNGTDVKDELKSGTNNITTEHCRPATNGRIKQEIHDTILNQSDKCSCTLVDGTNIVAGTSSNGRHLNKHTEVSDVSVNERRITDISVKGTDSLGHLDGVRAGTCLNNQSLVDGDAGVKTELGGDCEKFLTKYDEADVLPRASTITRLYCQKSGYVDGVEAYICGNVVRNLGAGRSRPDDVIDYSAGLRLLVNLGQQVTAGEAWVEVHHNRALSKEMTSALRSAISISSAQPVDSIPSVIDSFMQ